MNKKPALYVGAACIAILAFVLLSSKKQAAVVNSGNTVPLVNIPPLDLSTLGLDPINFNGGTSNPIPPIPNFGNDNDCCSCGANVPYESTFVNALDIAPPQPFLVPGSLTSQEQFAVQTGRAQVVYDPSSPRGFYVGVLASDIPGNTNAGIIFQGALNALPV